MRQLQSMGQALARCQIEVVQVNKLAEICRSLLLASELDRVGGDTRCGERRCETSDLDEFKTHILKMQARMERVAGRLNQ